MIFQFQAKYNHKKCKFLFNSYDSIRIKKLNSNTLIKE